MSSEITPTTVDVDTVRSKINDDSLRLIDVRREEDYNKGHIPNAVNLPLASLLSDDSPESVVKLAEDARTVLYASYPNYSPNYKIDR